MVVLPFTNTSYPFKTFTYMRIDIHFAILKVVSYFHFFKYPVTSQEIWKYMSISCEASAFETALLTLQEQNIIFSIDGFFSLANNPELIYNRRNGNLYAQKQLKKAYRIATFLGNFPFVESVCISGSLSKDFSLPDGDLDFFIITAPNRLWIARTFMHFFKKFTFLVNAQHSFCMNYYIGMENLDINPKNIFTAIELSTLKPAFTQSGVEEMFNTNSEWMKIFLPNDNKAAKHKNHLQKKWPVARLVESVIDKCNGDKLNTFLYNFTRKQWIKKWTRQKYDVQECLKCMDMHLNTPVNYPKNLMHVILDGHEGIYNKAAESAMKKFNSKAESENILNK